MSCPAATWPGRNSRRCATGEGREISKQGELGRQELVDQLSLEYGGGVLRNELCIFDLTSEAPKHEPASSSRDTKRAKYEARRDNGMTNAYRYADPVPAKGDRRAEERLPPPVDVSSIHVLKAMLV